MKNLSDRIIWESEIRTFDISAAQPEIRCPTDLSPKRINEPKLIASVARTTFVPYPKTIRSGPVICPSADKSQVRSLLRDLPLVTFLSTDWSSVMKWLTKITTAQVATIVGSLQPHRDPDLERFAEGLNAFNPNWQKAALENAKSQIERQKHLQQHLIALVGEDKPGKFLRIEPQNAALKQTAKRWTTLLSRPQNLEKNPVMAESGWGAGSAIFEPEGSRRLVCCELDISGREMHLAAVESWLERIKSWAYSRSEMSPGKIRNVTISTPYFSIAGYLQEALEKDFTGTIQTPDFIWGWHPLLTLLEFLRSSEEPTLLLNLHHGSGLQIGLVW